MWKSHSFSRSSKIRRCWLFEHYGQPTQHCHWYRSFSGFTINFKWTFSQRFQHSTAMPMSRLRKSFLLAFSQRAWERVSTLRTPSRCLRSMSTEISRSRLKIQGLDRTTCYQLDRWASQVRISAKFTSDFIFDLLNKSALYAHTANFSLPLISPQPQPPFSNT